MQTNKCIVSVVKEDKTEKHYVVRANDEGMCLIGNVAIHGEIAAITDTYIQAAEMVNKIV